MKLSPEAEKFLQLIREAGGSFCPDADQTVTPEVHRIIRQLARKGLLHVEQVDSGYRYSVREGEDG